MTYEADESPAMDESTTVPRVLRTKGLRDELFPARGGGPVPVRSADGASAGPRRREAREVLLSEQAPSRAAFVAGGSGPARPAPGASRPKTRLRPHIRPLHDL
jgi:hypothetical protein